MVRRWLSLTSLLLLLVTLSACATQPSAVAPPPAPSPTPIPNSVSLSVVGGKQTRNLTCESQSASDLAKFWGKSVGEIEFFNKLPRSDNPYKGFVGSENSPPGSLPPNGYGVYAEPIAATLREFGLDAEAHYKKGINWLRAELAAGRPVIVWSTYGFKENPVKTYKTRDGQEVPVVQYEHSFLAIGYDDKGITVIDPLDGLKKQYPYPEFYRGWGLLDQMAVSARLPVPPSVQSGAATTPVPAPAGPPLWIPLVAMTMLALGLLGLRARRPARRAVRMAHSVAIPTAVGQPPIPRRGLPSVAADRRRPAWAPLNRLTSLRLPTPAIRLPASVVRLGSLVVAFPLFRPLPLALVGLIVGMGLTVWLNTAATCMTLPLLGVSAGVGFWLGLWAQALAQGRRATADTRQPRNVTAN